jgi:hypothetical protein
LSIETQWIPESSDTKTKLSPFWATILTESRTTSSFCKLTDIFKGFSFEKTSLISLAKEDLASKIQQKKHLMMENLEII